MPATDVIFGVTLHTGSLIDNLEYDNKIEKFVLKGSDGVDARVHVANPTYSFSVTGHGTLSQVIGVGDSGLTNITTGVSVIESIKYSQINSGFDGWTYSGTNHPSASEVV